MLSITITFILFFVCPCSLHLSLFLSYYPSLFSLDVLFLTTFICINLNFILLLIGILFTFNLNFYVLTTLYRTVTNVGCVGSGTQRKTEITRNNRALQKVKKIEITISLRSIFPFHIFFLLLLFFFHGIA